MDPKYNSVAEMYETGMSIGEIADYYGITRQAMWKILSRRGVSFRPNTRNGNENHFYRGYSYKSKRAGHMVEHAIRKGILRRGPCEICKSVIDICGHHDDYNYPLKVRWLCKLHHFQWHEKNKPVPLLKPLPSMSHREIIALAHGKEANEKRSRTRRENKKGKCTLANGVFLLTAGVP